MNNYESPSIEAVGGGVEPMATLLVAFYMVIAAIIFAIAAGYLYVAWEYELIMLDSN